MVNAKFLEIRDRATCIPVLAIKTSPKLSDQPTVDDVIESKYFRRAGYDEFTIILIKLSTAESHYDCYEWSSQYTLGTAHKYIRDNYDSLENLQVIDCEVIRGEKKKPSESEIRRDSDYFFGDLFI